MITFDPMLRKILSARDELIDQYPLFGTLARLRYVNVGDHPDIRYAATDYRNILFNPEGLKDWTPLQLKMLMFHEHQHIAMLHNMRRGERDPKLWNMAGDFVINLQAHDIWGPDAFPKDGGGEIIGCLDEKYRGMSTEKVYEKLQESSAPQHQHPDWDFGGCDTPTDGNGDPIDADGVAELEEEIKESVGEAAGEQKRRDDAQKDRHCGEGSIMEQLGFDLDEDAGISFQTSLDQLLRAQTNHDWSYRVPDRYRSHEDVVFPSLSADGYKPPVIGVDTSGSISQEEVNEFLSQAMSILELYNFKEVEVIYCDWDICGREFLSPGDTPNPKGGGGTDFAPVFEDVVGRDETPIAVLYYTDGCCSSFGPEPDCPVLWALSEDNRFNPPFGEVARCR